MEGGNTNEYANLVRQTDEYGNPLYTTLDNARRQGLSTNVGHATGGAGCYYDFGDATGVGFSGAGTYLNQPRTTAVGAGGGLVKETGAGDGDHKPIRQKGEDKEATDKIKS